MQVFGMHLEHFGMSTCTAEIVEMTYLTVLKDNSVPVGVA